MRTYKALFLALPSLCSTVALAEQKSFHNMLSISRSIISPSQYYQHREGILAEADFAVSDGAFEIKSNTAATNLDIKGSELGVGGYIAVNPSLVFGVTADQTILDIEENSKFEELWVRPSVTYSPIATLSLAAQVNILRGSTKADAGETQNANSNNFTFGMTAHQEDWEATAVLSTKKEDDGNELNSLPQTVGLHARYHLVEPITLGITYEQQDLTGIAPSETEIEDQTRLGVHMESAMSETVAVEVDYFSTTHESGTRDQDASEFVVLGQILLSPTIEAGAKISYISINGSGVDGKIVSPGLFVAAKF